MIIDISKIPTTCKYNIWSGSDTKDGSFGCRIEEPLRGRVTSAYAYGKTPQEAVDNAVRKFLT